MKIMGKENSLVKTKSNHALSLVVSDDTKVHGNITVGDIRLATIGNENKEVLLARYTGKRISELDANYAGEQLKTFINLTIFESGYKTENISLLIISVIKDIFADFGHLTLEEVRLAYRMGIRKKFGDFMGMSVITFYGWLKTYTETLMLEAHRTMLMIRKEETIQISEEKKQELHMNWLNAHIEDFERRKIGEAVKQYDFGHLFYNYCQKNGIGYLTRLEKRELYEEAKVAVINNHSVQNAKDIYEAKDFRKLVSDIESGEIDESAEEKIKAQARRLAVPKIFDKLIESGIDLSDVIKAIEKK